MKVRSAVLHFREMHVQAFGSECADHADQNGAAVRDKGPEVDCPMRALGGAEMDFRDGIAAPSRKELDADLAAPAPAHLSRSGQSPAVNADLERVWKVLRCRRQSGTALRKVDDRAFVFLIARFDECGWAARGARL